MKKLSFVFIVFILVFVSCTKTKCNPNMAKAIHDTVFLKNTVNKSVIKQGNKTSKKITFTCLQLNYTKQIEGYNVSVLWIPESEVSKGIIGKAIMHFKYKNGKTFNLTHNFFVSSVIDSNTKTGKPIIDPNKTAYSIDNYSSPNISNPLTGDNLEPFLFADVNFDGKKELLLTKAQQGQRHANSFEVYLIDNDGCLVDDCYQITHEMPFAELDAYSVLNKTRKTIKIHSSGGAYNWVDKLYAIDQIETESYGTTKFRLIKLEVCENGVITRKRLK